MTGPTRRAARTVPWKVFWPAVGAVLTGSGATLAALFALPVLLTAPAAIVLAATFVVGAHLVVHRSALFADARYQSQVLIVRLIGAAAVLHVVWVVLFGLRPVMWPVWWLILAGIVGLEIGVAGAHEYLLTRPRPASQPAQSTGPPSEQRLTDPEKQFAAGLRKAELGAATVIGSTPIVDDETGRTFGMTFEIRAPPGR